MRRRPILRPDRKPRGGVLLVLVAALALFPATSFAARYHVLRHLIDEDVTPPVADRGIPTLRSALALVSQPPCPPGCEQGRNGPAVKSPCAASCQIEPRLNLLFALSRGNAGASEVLACLDSLLLLVPEDRSVRAIAMSMAARGLARRGEELPRARQLAEAALELGGASDPYDNKGISYLATIAEIQLRCGQADSAARLWKRVIDEKRHPDLLMRQRALVRLGVAWESAGREREALDAFVQAAGCYLRADTSADRRAFAAAQQLGLAADSLRAVIGTLRDSSRCEMLFHEHLASKYLTAYHLHDLAGVPCDQIELEGHYTLVEFRDLGCLYCRATAMRLDLVKATLGDSTIGTRCFVEVPIEGTTEDKRQFAERVLAGRAPRTRIILDENGNLAEKLGLEDTPALLVMNPERRVRYQVLGACPPQGRVVAELFAHVRAAGGKVDTGCE